MPPPSRETLDLRQAALPGPYPAHVIRVIDGDTFEARVRVWFGQEISTLVRIRGMDAPELKAQCVHEAEAARLAYDVLTEKLRAGAVVLSNVSVDKYFGRVVASVNIRAADSNDDASEFMIAGGYARPYERGRRDGWCTSPG